jgi:hypothetical protein
MALVSTRRFAYDPDTQTFSADASDLHDYHGWCALMNIELQSARTGAVVDFVFQRCERDPDGDITRWVFESDFSGLPSMYLVIYND